MSYLNLSFILCYICVLFFNLLFMTWSSFKYFFYGFLPSLATINTLLLESSFMPPEIFEILKIAVSSLTGILSSLLIKWLEKKLKEKSPQNPQTFKKSYVEEQDSTVKKIKQF